MATNGLPTRFALLDRIPLGACVLRRDFEVLFWNTCLEEWTGIERGQIVGQVISERFAHLAEAKYLHRLRPIFDGGPPAVFSSQLHRHMIPAAMPDGKLRVQHTVVTCLPRPDDDGFDALLSIQDVTDLTRSVEEHRAMRDQALQEIRERRRAEEERRRMEVQILHARKFESLGVLAGGIAHDFNNLLVSILGNADLALKDLGEVHPAFEPIEAVVTAGRRAAVLCDQMLAYAGKRRLVKERLDLSEWVREMASLLEISISAKVDLKLRPADVPAFIEADPSQLRQIVVNLVGNASEALGEGGGEIVLSTGVDALTAEDLPTYLGQDLEPGRFVFLQVRDTGSGMDQETQEKIFDPFFTTKFPGRGLGLAATLGLVRGHGGALRVESDPGRGTTIRVLLPGAEEERPTVREAPLRGAERTANAILVVDDEEMVRLMAQTVLQRAGFEVFAAADGHEALDIFFRQGDQVAAVLLDMTMPNLAGDATFLELQRLCPGLPVILTSGYTEQAANEQIGGEQIKGEGPAGFIQKPYRPKDLVALVKRAIDG